VPKVGILYNDTKPVACRVADELKKQLSTRGCKVSMATSFGGILSYSTPERPTCRTHIDTLIPAGFDKDIAFGIVLGGDGTVLAAFRQVAPCGIPLLAVNTGHMGFLTESYVNQLPHAVEQLLAGEYEIEERSMLVVRVLRKEELLWEALCLNEMVLHREPLTSMVQNRGINDGFADLTVRGADLMADELETSELGTLRLLTFRRYGPSREQTAPLLLLARLRERLSSAPDYPSEQSE